jgi:branched-chain amino acid transport system permease protein
MSWAGRISKALLALVAAVLMLPLLAGSAAAAEEDLHGRLKSEVGGVSTPAANVRISVADEAGKAIGEVRSDADGVWTLPLPGPGTYRVELDPATLPEGITLRDPDRKTLTVEVFGNQQRPLLFPLGQGKVVESHQVDRVVQLVAEGLRFGLILALAALGLSLIYGTTGLVNFCHGELITLGAMVAYFVNVVLGLHLLAAAAIAVVVCGIAGYLQDVLFWGRLRKRGTGLNSMMIISIGAALFVRYLYLYLFGPDPSAYTDFRSQSAVDLGGFPVRLAPRDYWSMGIAAVMIALVLVLLMRSRLGKAARAVADNPALAAASGIDVERVIRLVWIIGTALAGLAGILIGVAQQVHYAMGFSILLLVFAAVTLGGLGTAVGALVGSLVVGVLIQLSTLVVAPELKYVGALGVLIIILLVRPQGILGRAQRIG